MELSQAFDRSAKLIRSAGFEPLYMAVKGSMLYNMPGTHKDIDVRAIYIAPTAEVLSIRKPQQTFKRMEGELDLVGWEVEKLFSHLLRHNGNMIEALLAPPSKIWVPEASRWLTCWAQLRDLGPQFITQRLGAYYKGFAWNQLKRAQRTGDAWARTGKNILYGIRELLAGLVLLRTGQLVFDFNELTALCRGTYSFHSIDNVSMDRAEVEPELLALFEKEVTELSEEMDRVHSPLPRGFDGYAACNALLLEWRSKAVSAS